MPSNKWPAVGGPQPRKGSKLPVMLGMWSRMVEGMA